jgi:beta-galactosidase
MPGVATAEDSELTDRIGLQVPFGAVYFRKSNPPREDWERDYKVAAEDGLNIFRHWFMWSAIERGPGRFDWDDYDRQLDLAAENGIRTIIAELTHTVPDWAYRRFAHARQIRADGTPLPSIMGVSAATGGFAPNGGGAGSLTMNAPEVREAVGAFLTALAERYKGHPGLLGYDVWNECNYAPTVDYSVQTKAAFRDWLRAKYGTLDALAPAWNRYSHAEWDDVEPPVQVGPYPECLDWLKFKRDDYYAQMQFKIDTIRAVDPDCLIAAHGVAGAITDMAARGCDDWLAASKVEVYGYTWIQARKGAQPWRNFFAGDLVRGASRGKPFWHAERQGGPLWMQPQVVGRGKQDGRVAEPEDIRLWSLSSFAAGARGMLNLRYRPLLDGPLWGAFGSYGMDGSRTPRSDMASRLAKWLNAPEQADLMAAQPARGDIGILVVPEVQEFDYLLSHEGGFETYREAMWGAYRGFFDNNIQADWAHVDDIDRYDVLYFPYPISFPQQVADRLAAWVAAGGQLIAEACPGYFGDHGHVGTRQPNLGLDAVFGAVEDEVEFMPDIGDRIGFAFDGLDVQSGGFLQSYRLAGGAERGRFSDGRLAVVEHRHGSGRTLLVGTNPSVGYWRTSAEANRRFFAECLQWSGAEPRLRSSNPKVQARFHAGAAGTYVWIVNPTREVQCGRLMVRDVELSSIEGAVSWPAEGGDLSKGRFRVPPRDALIVGLGVTERIRSDVGRADASAPSR